MFLSLPFPPSVNKAYRAMPTPTRGRGKAMARCRCGCGWNARNILSKEGRAYSAAVKAAVGKVDMFTDPVAVVYTFHYQNRRAYDVGNFIKVLDDALEAAGVLENDALIDDQRLVRGAVDKENPRVEITIEKVEA